MRGLAAGNWKMNGTAEDLEEVRKLISDHPAPACDMLLCPPATLLARMADIAAGSALQIGGQDCHAALSGAHTGDISAPMLRDAGATHVILGHSERRQDHRETDAMIRAKLETALSQNLAAILCLGETREERKGGRTLDIVGTQIETGTKNLDYTAGNLVIAYEPVWAIGTGLTPTLKEIAEVHAFLRDRLQGACGGNGAGPGVRILYGGSVKPGNAAEIFALPHVNGALVGGASLKAADFGAIVAALAAA
ncbi:MAG: triose-phosphate isomerase [Pseudorhodobacter sp.]